MKTKKWLCAIALFFISIVIYELIASFIFFRKIDIPIKIYNQIDYLNAENILSKDYKPLTSKTKQEYKSIIEVQLNLNFYIYTEKDLKSSYNGLTFIVIRTMILDSTLNGYEYCLVFAHEAMHFKKFVSNEKYICFETFKYLYENEDENLHNVGVWYGLEQLSRKFSGEYDCRDCIINYFI